MLSIECINRLSSLHVSLMNDISYFGDCSQLQRCREYFDDVYSVNREVK